MTHPCSIEVTDAALADKTRQHVTLGHRFAFTRRGAGPTEGGRRARLFSHKTSRERAVHVLGRGKLELPGLTVIGDALKTPPVGAVLADRDLYRAEQDNAHLFVALPRAKGEVKLVVTQHGAFFTERVLDEQMAPSLFAHGVHVETLAMLLPGSYAVELHVDGEAAGSPARFTVAAYTLAPLTARLSSYSLERAEGRLRFALEVESYGAPLTTALRVELLDDARVVDSVNVEASEPGRFAGALKIDGEGSLRLRLAVERDAERTAEVAIPGSRKRERDVTIVSELGTEVGYSLMPEPGALPVRGGYLTEGDFLATPIVVEEVITKRGRLVVKQAVEALTLLVWDLVAREATVIEHGDAAAGDVVEVVLPSAMCMVYVGCFVKERPFEAYTCFAKSGELALEVRMPDEVRPGGAVKIELSSPHKGRLPVLLSVRDERLTTTDTPDAALSSSVKRAIERAADGLGEQFSWTELSDDATWRSLLAPMWSSGVAGIGVMVRQGAGPWRSEEFWQDELMIGRVPGNHLVLPSANVAKRHARVVVRDGKLIVVDLKSVNGTFVDGKRISSPQVLRDGQALQIGEHTVVLRALGMELPPAPPPAPPYLASTASPPRAQPGGFFQRVLAGIEELAAPRGPAFYDDETDALGGAAPDRAARARSAPSAAPVAGRAMAKSYAAEAVSGHAADDDALFDDADLDVEERSAVLCEAEADDEPSQAEGAAAEDEARADFPQVLFFGLVDLDDGYASLEVPVGDELGAFTVEAFALTEHDWVRRRALLRVDQPCRADLRLPLAMSADDKVEGKLRATAKSGRVRVSLTRDGERVALVDGGAEVGAAATLASPAELAFAAKPGRYVATVEDAAGGERDSVELFVDEPGTVRAYVRELMLVPKGETVTLDDARALSLRVLPGLEEPFATLGSATMAYQHACCEQTGAKILAAVALYLSSSDEVQQRKAEQSILAGIAREKLMWMKGQGFAPYPGYGSPSEHYTPMVVRYLWRLDDLASLPRVSPALREAARSGVEMADDVARARRMSRTPARIASMADAYEVLRHGGDRPAALAYLESELALDEKEPSVRRSQGAVQDRVRLAYAGAALYALGELVKALRVTNVVMRQLNGDGRLYSTLDSAAAIALLGEAKKRGVSDGGARVVVNGRAMLASEAAALQDRVEHLVVEHGVCVVEALRLSEERWERYDARFAVRVGFRDATGAAKRRFAPGERAELVVELPEGYKEGDLLHVCLPPSLSWLEGGGRVARFTADFEGTTSVRVPVVVTGKLTGKQRFAVCVRNMFEEERAAFPGWLTVDAA